MKCPVALSSDLEQTVENRPTRKNTNAIHVACRTSPDKAAPERASFLGDHYQQI
jgi:hypothetical protein